MKKVLRSMTEEEKKLVIIAIHDENLNDFADEIYVI